MDLLLKPESSPEADHSGWLRALHASSGQRIIHSPTPPNVEYSQYLIIYHIMGALHIGGVGGLISGGGD